MPVNGLRSITAQTAGYALSADGEPRRRRLKGQFAKTDAKAFPVPKDFGDSLACTMPATGAAAAPETAPPLVNCLTPSNAKTSQVFFTAIFKVSAVDRNADGDQSAQ